VVLRHARCTHTQGSTVEVGAPLIAALNTLLHRCLALLNTSNSNSSSSASNGHANGHGNGQTMPPPRQHLRHHQIEGAALQGLAASAHAEGGAVRISECALGALRVLVNLTHHNEFACAAVGSSGCLQTLIGVLLASR
jgi:Wings apart-like protein regulation of heterochromatin